MFEITKPMAAAIKRAFGSRPSNAVVSGDGTVTNYETTLVAHGSVGDAADTVALTSAAPRFMEAIAGGEVVVTVEGDRVTVDTGVGEVVLNGEAVPGHRPSTPVSESVSVPLSKSEWSALYASTSADDTVPIMQATAVLRDSEGALHVASTDRYRLTAVNVSDRATVSEGFDKSALVSRPVVATAKALPVKSAATLVAGENVNGRGVAGFTSDLFDMFAIEIEGDYPKVLSLFPKDTRERFTVSDAKGAAATVKSMSKHIRRNNPIRVDLTDGGVSLRGGSSDDDYCATVPVRAEVVDAEDHRTGFNTKFFADALGMAGKGGVTFAQGEARKPAVMTFDAAPTVRHLLMPIIRF